MSRLVWVAAAAAALVSVGAVLVAGTAEPVLPEQPRGSTVVASSAQTLVCPGAEVDRRSRRAVTVVVPRRPGGGEDVGPRDAVTVSPVTGGPAALGAPDARLSEPGASAVVPYVAASPVAVRGTGSLSPGIGAVQWAVYAGDVVSGIAATACQAPGDDWWFNGVDTSLGATSTVLLTNSAPALAVVDLTLHGPNGSIQAVGARGIALAPGSTTSIDLSRFAPGLAALSVQVHADQGEVMAAVRIDRAHGVTPAGSDWVPASSAPSRDVLVNAAPAAAAQSLVISNPGSREALVQVHLIDAGGQFVPTGLSDVRVPPGAVHVLDLTSATRGEATAVHLTSTVPIGGATVSSSTAKVADFALTGSSPTLSTAAVVPVIPGAALSLRFAADAKGSTDVALSVVDATGASLSRDDVRVAGATLTTWSLPASAKAAYVVVSADAAAGVQGAASYEGALGVTTVPILPGTYTVSRPAVAAVQTP